MIPEFVVIDLQITSVKAKASMGPIKNIILFDIEISTISLVKSLIASAKG